MESTGIPLHYPGMGFVFPRPRSPPLEQGRTLNVPSQGYESFEVPWKSHGLFFSWTLWVVRFPPVARYGVSVSSEISLSRNLSTVPVSFRLWVSVVKVDPHRRGGEERRGVFHKIRRRPFPPLSFTDVEKIEGEGWEIVGSFGLHPGSTFSAPSN